MGNSTGSGTKPTPNVRERHSQALYINVPISATDINHFLLDPCRADLFEDSCWISVVIDDLDILESYCMSGLYIPTGMQGWMCKVNLLVNCDVGDLKGAVGIQDEEKDQVHGYQILTIDFECGIGGNIKTLGARATQCIPTTTSVFRMSSGKSGATYGSEMGAGLAYESCMFNSESAGEPLVILKGTFCEHNSIDERIGNLMEFVTARPNKFLNQVGKSYNGYKRNLQSGESHSLPSDSSLARPKLAYSPEGGKGTWCNHKDCVPLEVQELSLPILGRLGLLGKVDIKKAVCFVQPEYKLIDCHNTIIN